MRKACQADLVVKPLIIKGIVGNKNPPAYVFNGLARWKYICVPTDVAVIHRVIHRLPLLLSSILLFQGKKTVVRQWLKYGYGD
jgi:hypothetical protein